MASAMGKIMKNTRSVSLPSRSHPSTVSVEEELNKIKSWEATSPLSLGSIRSGLDRLVNLYLSLDDLLNMSSTQQVLSMNQTEKRVDQLLDGSVKLLDICGIIRELALQIKEHVQVLQSALRRRKGDSSIETSIRDYTLFRKRMKKDAKRLIGSLKQMDNELGLGLAPSMLGQDRDHLIAVIRVLSEVNASSSSVFQSLLSLLSTPISNPKRTKWSLVKKLVHKGVIACEEKHAAANEIECVDAFLYSHISNEAADAEKAQFIHKQLVPLEMSISDLDDGLEYLFRRMIKARANLLNIFSSRRSHRLVDFYF